MGNEEENQSLVANFFTRTSLHALPDFQLSRTGFRWAWIMLFLAGLGGASYEIYQVVDGYMGSPLITSYRYSTASSIEFPEILICTGNFINSTKVKELNLSFELVGAARAGLIDLPALLVFNGLRIPLYGSSPNLTAATDPPNVNLEDLFLKIGMDADQLFRSCLFGGEPFDCMKKITPVFDKALGKCFLIKVDRPQTVATLGLVLQLDLHLNETWMMPPSFVEGAYVFVYRKYDPTDYEAINVPPSKSTRISLEGTQYALDEGDGSNCKKDIPREILNGPYTANVCYNECLQRALFRNCSCVLNTARKNLVHLYPICQLPQQQRCVSSFLRYNMKTIGPCVADCRPPCNYWQYSATVSYNSLAPSVFTEYMKQFTAESERWAKDLLIIDVGFKEIQYTIVEQFPSMTIDGFISQIGGHLGLFLGASLISLVQFFFMAFEKYWESSSGEKKTASVGIMTTVASKVPLK